MMDLSSAAFRLALRGLSVFPLSPGTKVPLAGSRGCRDASNDCDVARARWTKRRTCNIGIATGIRSGVWVLDVDKHHGGLDSLAKLEASNGRLPETVETSTPNGGRHLYFRWRADGPEIRNSCGRVAIGIDVRGEGGSAVAPPSVLADGRRYRWVRNGAKGAADAPAWLTEAALPPPAPPPSEPRPLRGDVSDYVAAAVVAELANLGSAINGQRNETLNRVAFNLAQFVKADVLPEDWARTELERRSAEIGLSAHEARGTIASAFAAAQPRELRR